jgi:hypothetical protein
VRDGDVEFVQVACSMVVVPLVQGAIVRLDERRLSAERLARAWPPSTRDVVVFATWQFGILFGCPALLVWFVRTRGWLVGFLLGLAAAALLLGAAILATVVPEAIIEGLGL